MKLVPLFAMAVTLLATSCVSLKSGESAFDKIAMPSNIVWVPLDPNSLHAVVDVAIGAKTYHFALDTGAPLTVVSTRVVLENPKAFSQIDQDDSGRVVYGLGELSLGEATVSHVVAFSDKQIDPILSLGGIDGLIGMSILGQQYFEIDKSHNTLALFREHPPIENGIDISTLWDNRIVIDGSVDGEPARWSIDTGTALAYYLSDGYFTRKPPSLIKHSLEGKVAQEYYFQAADDDPRFFSARNVQIGDHHYPYFAFRGLSVQPFYKYDHSGSGIDTAGLIGLGLFSGSVLKVDYPRRKLQWSESPRPEPIVKDSLLQFGIELIAAPPPALWQVVGLDPEGWAYESGLRVGDILFTNILLENRQRDTLMAQQTILEYDGTFPLSLTYERHGVRKTMIANYYSPYLEDFRK